MVQVVGTILLVIIVLCIFRMLQLGVRGQGLSDMLRDKCNVCGENEVSVLGGHGDTCCANMECVKYKDPMPNGLIHQK